ncbi:uncharacterized protein DUF3955 [Aliiruegeria haliotis]|uniref:Uncharacterized protein DUF3955 n=1 Tax=Aliiruegeria haliotis TaxID=1280846 RepID=A0A2T0RM47_9RHOB|nr:DUF3955 domain-containing protein [Aliiruegeria haliotis]PRY22238.1 uncharacterized protein DUF3955 [Aliiruegeria haliotis]
MTPKRLLQIALVAFMAAALSLGAERVWYGGISEDGTLQESLFLPLGFAFALLAVVAVLGALVLKARGGSRQTGRNGPKSKLRKTKQKEK